MEFQDPDTSEKHLELLRHLRGIRRVVINQCHGGFSLSDEAAVRYCEMAGIDPDDNNFWNRSIDRDDPYLVKVIETLGADRASGDFAELKIVEIPADVDWEICEYDGREWVAEKHRTWS